MAPPDSHRICLALHYDGGRFFGWQLQPGLRTVQGELERVLSRLLNAPTRVIGSGRTDRGVHATGQFATVDAPRRWTSAEMRRAMNALLPDDLWVSGAWIVAPRFHPRYDARSRAYLYRVGLTESSRSPFHARWCWPVARPLEVEAMREASTALVGDHSFLAFAKAGQEHRGDRCIVHDARWKPWSGLGIEFHISANRFLHHMVRYLVGTMVEIGMGRRPGSDLARLLRPGPGMDTSPPAPPEGLFLRAVAYPDPPYGPDLGGGAGPPAGLPDHP